MIPATVEPAMWPRVRWWLAVIFVLLVQVGLVYWLSDRSVVTPRPPASVPAVFLVQDALVRLPTVTDPLLFSPANPNGFSGGVWSKTPKLEFHLADWTAPPSLLGLQTRQLGNAFTKFVRTNNTSSFTVADNPEPRLSSPELFLTVTPVPTQSELRVEGELLQRTFASPMVLTNWPGTNILTPTVVQVMVDLDGKTVSASVLSKSGSTDADKQALNLAKAARYSSIRNHGASQSPVSKLTWGRLIFEWHTVALPPAGPPPRKP
ncbi:MAG: energy transducer TonB [Verrucomicrobia bacterium]|nr:energy transducer TonB [Verrucomicrobiota bacterium]